MIAQVIDVQADPSLTLEVPHETSAHSHPCPICARNIDPETGNPKYGPKTVAAIEEGNAMMRGEIPAKWFSSLAEMLDDLKKDDPDDE